MRSDLQDPCTVQNKQQSPEGAVKTCGSCKGQGVKIVLRQLGPMVQQIQQPCNDCNGEGEIINAKDRCKDCNGKKIVNERKVLEVHIDRGMKEGQTVTFSGEADQSPGVEPGDVVIVIEEKPHELFKRKGDDLFCEVEIDLLTALAGGSFTIMHLDERALHVTIPPGEVIKPGKPTSNSNLNLPRQRDGLIDSPSCDFSLFVGTLKNLPGQGMPSHRHHEMGDLIVQINVTFPEKLDPTLLAPLEQILPPRPDQPQYPKNIHIDEVDMVDASERRTKSGMGNGGHSHGDAMDTDDEDGQGGGPQVQCANREFLFRLSSSVPSFRRSQC